MEEKLEFTRTDLIAAFQKWHDETQCEYDAAQQADTLIGYLKSED